MMTPEQQAAIRGENPTVEIMARAYSTDWDAADDQQRTWWRLKSLDVLKALEAAEIVTVPVEPTEAMIEASNREWDGRMSHRSSGAWKAMVAARPR